MRRAPVPDNACTPANRRSFNTLCPFPNANSVERRQNAGLPANITHNRINHGHTYIIHHPGRRQTPQSARAAHIFKQHRQQHRLACLQSARTPDHLSSHAQLNAEPPSPQRATPTAGHNRKQHRTGQVNAPSRHQRMAPPQRAHLSSLVTEGTNTHVDLLGRGALLARIHAHKRRLRTQPPHSTGLPLPH